MPNQVEAVEAPAVEEQARDWRPSGRPEHRAGAEGAHGQIREEAEEKGFLGRLADFFRIPFVRLVIGLGIFILAAIIYDNTLNFGSWTEKAEKPKAAEHKGSAGVQQTPE